MIRTFPSSVSAEKSTNSKIVINLYLYLAMKMNHSEEKISSSWVTIHEHHVPAQQAMSRQVGESFKSC